MKIKTRVRQRFLIGLCITLAASVGIFGYFRSATNKLSPPATATYFNKELKVTVDYCRPYKKGRVIFGDEKTGALQPYGKYWRMGANEATKFSTNKDILVNDQFLRAGRYSVYAFPGPDKWVIAFNKVYERWGISPPDEENDALRTEVSCNNNASLREQFLISFDKPDSLPQTNMILHWDQTMVRVPIQLAPGKF